MRRLAKQSLILTNIEYDPYMRYAPNISPTLYVIMKLSIQCFIFTLLEVFRSYPVTARRQLLYIVLYCYYVFLLAFKVKCCSDVFPSSGGQAQSNLNHPVYTKLQLGYIKLYSTRRPSTQGRYLKNYPGVVSCQTLVIFIFIIQSNECIYYCVSLFIMIIVIHYNNI